MKALGGRTWAPVTSSPPTPSTPLPSGSTKQGQPGQAGTSPKIGPAVDQRPEFLSPSGSEKATFTSCYSMEFESFFYSQKVLWIT